MSLCWQSMSIVGPTRKDRPPVPNGIAFPLIDHIDNLGGTVLLEQILLGGGVRWLAVVAQSAFAYI